ncbi:MAG: hypothetical protein ACE5HX_15275 [bacterium]
MNTFSKLRGVKTLLVDDDEFIEKPFSVKALVQLLALLLKRQDKNRAISMK